MKQLIHLLAPFALWVIGLALYIVTITNTMPKRIDSVKTYHLQKKPHSFEDALYNIRDAFTANWATDDCWGNVTGNSGCVTKRTDLSTKINTAMECTTYASQACSCIGKITTGIANPGKNLRGKRDDTKYALESCRLLMHNAHVAVFSDKVWAQKTALLLLILTLATGNAFDWVVVNYWTSAMDETSRSIVKVFVLVIWGLIPMLISVIIDMNTFTIFLYILLPPIILLVLYEMYKGTYVFPEYPFVHPYVFACTLGALTLLAHAEAGILDNDIIIFEIIKCNVASYIYLQVVWKYMIKNLKQDYSYSKFVQDGTLRGVILVFLLYVIGCMAPYPTSYTTLLMWYTPLLWVVLAFASVVWVSSFDYSEYFGGKVEPSKDKRFNSWEILPASQHVSTLVLIFLFLVLLYYIRENSTVFANLIDKYPTNSLQYNTSTAWMRAPALVSS